MVVELEVVHEKRKGGGAGNATGIINYHSNFLFGTNLITNDHERSLIFPYLAMTNAIVCNVGRKFGNCLTKKHSKKNRSQQNHG